jgi:hypothetical protein
VSTRIDQTDIDNKSNNRESRQQQGLVPVQHSIQRSKSLQYNMEEIESDTNSNLRALFQDSDNYSIETEQDVVQAPVQADEKGVSRLATQNTDVIINQLKLQPTTRSPCLYADYHRGNNMVVERQRGGIGAPLDDMNKEVVDSAQGGLADNSDNTEAVVSVGDW